MKMVSFVEGELCKCTIINKCVQYNPDNEDGQLCSRGTVEVYNFKLLMFRRALIVQNSIFKTALRLTMKMVRLVDRETRATAN